MAQGTSLHIGLNTVSPAAYRNPTPLSGCVNDANDMRQIALSRGFQTHGLTDEGATAAAVIDLLSMSARRMRAGDLMFVTYSGHGGSVLDESGDEADGKDETWCLYDRMLFDDELATIWAQFARGVRIVVLSDSCHSGTVLRQIRLPAPDGLAPPAARVILPPPARMLRAASPATLGAAPDARASDPRASDPRVTGPRTLRLRATAQPALIEAAARSIRTRAAQRRIVPRAMAPAATLAALESDPDTYTTIRALTRAARDMTIEASVLLISGCRDDQLSADGDRNGLFTETLREVWADGAFRGDYRSFHRAILDRMPEDQSPELMTLGRDDPAFLAEMPFTITQSAAAEPVAAALWVRGPDHAPADGPPPVFRVNPGPNPWFVFEAATDPALFDTGRAQAQRTATTFYGSWSDSPHLSGADYTLPAAVWDRLKEAGRIWYRIGSTAQSTGWANYMVSTADQRPDLAPSLIVDPAAPADPDSPTAEGPSIEGPAQAAPDGPPPVFAVNRDGAPWYVVEVATRPELFDLSGHGAERDAGNFYGSWSDSPLQDGVEYALPEAVWHALDLGGGLLYYRAGTTQSAAWEDYRVTTPDDDPEGAPFIVIG